MRRMGEARFASAMAMGMMSGLNTEDAFRTAMLFQDVNPKTKKRYEKCLEMLEVGEPMAKSFRERSVGSVILPDIRFGRQKWYIRYGNGRNFTAYGRQSAVGNCTKSWKD